MFESSSLVDYPSGRQLLSPPMTDLKRRPFTQRPMLRAR
jgi:hypothetical protein